MANPLIPDGGKGHGLRGATCDNSIRTYGDICVRLTVLTDAHGTITAKRKRTGGSSRDPIEMGYSGTSVKPKRFQSSKDVKMTNKYMIA